MSIPYDRLAIPASMRQALREDAPRPAQMALARSRIYSLLGQIYLSGLKEEDLDRVRAVPDLASVVPEPFQTDEAAADHQHLFGFNVFPYESIFLDVTGLMGGDVTDDVVASYQAAGYSGWEGSEGADHIGREFSCMAFLCGAEHDAWEDQLPVAARRMAGLQAKFLDRHLLRWLPPFVLAIREHGQPFYKAAADLTLDVVTDHRVRAAGQIVTTYRLPSKPDLLGDENTGLKEIAATLLTPAYSGLYLSRDDIGRLAQRHKLPRGFGGRQNMLLNLLRSAANYGGSVAMLTELQSLAARWAIEYGAMAAGSPWGIRAESTSKILEDMKAHAAGLAE